MHNEDAIPLQKDALHFHQHLALESEVHKIRSWLDDRDEASGRPVTTTSTTASGTEKSSTEHGTFKDNSEFTCGTCQVVFSTNSLLKRHASVHYKSRNFPCEDCSVSFLTEGHLKKHRRSEGHKNTVHFRQTQYQEPMAMLNGEVQPSDSSVTYSGEFEETLHVRRAQYSPPNTFSRTNGDNLRIDHETMRHSHVEADAEFTCRNSSTMKHMCHLCGFVPKNKIKHTEKYDHIYKKHFKEKLDTILPQNSPFSCPRAMCEHYAKDKRSLIRHYVSKHLCGALAEEDINFNNL